EHGKGIENAKPEAIAFVDGFMFSRAPKLRDALYTETESERSRLDVENKATLALSVISLGNAVRNFGNFLQGLVRATPTGVPVVKAVDELAAKEAAGASKNSNVTSAITDAEAGTSGLPKLGSLKGEPELPPKNASPDMVRSIERQNEASKKLAQAGFDVEQLANTGRKGGNPDLRINGDLADVFSPRTNSPISVLMTVTEKVEKQASSVVVNLADSPLTFGEIEKALRSRPVEGLKKLYLMKNNEFRVIEASK
ncbi:MAG: hypothetical protein ACN6OP_21595, partial [Pseudomonadales bacterium]